MNENQCPLLLFLGQKDRCNVFEILFTQVSSPWLYHLISEQQPTIWFHRETGMCFTTTNAFQINVFSCGIFWNSDKTLGKFGVLIFPVCHAPIRVRRYPGHFTDYFYLLLCLLCITECKNQPGTQFFRAKYLWGRPYFNHFANFLWHYLQEIA